MVLCSVTNIIANRISAHGFLEPFLLNVPGSPSLLCILGSHILFGLNQALDDNVDRNMAGGFLSPMSESNSEIRCS